MLRRDQAASAAIMRKKADRPALQGDAAALFEKLRAERARLAREQSVPAYVIFHDATLAAIATTRPRSLEALGEIPGMGKTKIERYGAVIMEAMA
jgi:ATP-dependent DNA helicase RecQ